MSEEEKIEGLIIDYLYGKLSASDQEFVKRQIEKDERYRRLEQEYRLLLGTMDQKELALPSAQMKAGFEAMLLREEASRSNSEAPSTKMIQVPLKTIYRVVAMLTLMVGSYWWGHYTTQQDYLPELADLEIQKQEWKAMAALSLFESESASKRIQAVTLSMELDQPDLEILEALIDEMLYDPLVNVRFASARALEQFSEQDRVKEAFIAALKTEKNAALQIELIEILSHLKERRAIPPMKALLEDEDTPGFIKEQVKTELEKLI